VQGNSGKGLGTSWILAFLQYVTEKAHKNIHQVVDFKFRKVMLASNMPIFL